MIESIIDGSVARFTIRRPEVGNAMRGVDVAELAKGVRDALANPAVRVLVIAGEGPKFFCTGGDLRELSEGFADIGLHIRKWHDLVDLIEAAEKPVIAALNGHAVGGGLELALACHLRFAASNSRMGLPELKVGSFPSAGGVRRLTRLLGSAVALDLVLSADLWTADVALAKGLVHAVCPADQLEQRIADMIERLTSFEANAVRSVLVCARAAALDIDSVELEISLLRECYQTPANRTRLQAFMDQLGDAKASRSNKELRS